MNSSISGKSDAAGTTLRSAEAVACEDSSGAHAVDRGRVGARRFRPGALARLLVVKASCDLVFVLCLVVWFFFSAFDPRFMGEVELKDGVLSGRVVGRSDSPITIQLFVDNRYVAGQDVRCAARISTLR